MEGGVIKHLKWFLLDPFGRKRRMLDIVARDILRSPIKMTQKGSRPERLK